MQQAKPLRCRFIHDARPLGGRAPHPRSRPADGHAAAPHHPRRDSRITAWPCEGSRCAHRDLPPTRCGLRRQRPRPDHRDTERARVTGRVGEFAADPHLFPVDHTLCGTGADRPEVRTVPHLHGARVPPDSDGYPEHWFTPGGSAALPLPNRQDATTLWYHDHAIGIERLNQGAGLFGAFIIRDDRGRVALTERALRASARPVRPNHG